MENKLPTKHCFSRDQNFINKLKIYPRNIRVKLTLSQTRPGFYISAVFSTCEENFLQF